MVAHLSQIAHMLNLSISTWGRRFGHFAQVSASPPSGVAEPIGSAKRAPVFLWCGRDALEQLQLIKPKGVDDLATTSISTTIAGSSTMQGSSWPSADGSYLGQAPTLLEATTILGGRLPGFRCEERAARSGTRGLRGLLRGGKGPAGQYVSGKYGAAKAQHAMRQTRVMASRRFG
jgi:hypothetical protein